ncbi:ATP-dependent helicase [Mycobacterium sp. DL440]|uniref:ATP-dependent helicase n=1 Tax=Mycobacterium sp. DL440 TaxID=2675523 RepID=UPI00141EEFB3|nr:ATP-dependent helicase [Mycobacterium sp. DL440]
MAALSESIARLRSNDKQWQAFQASGHCVVLAPPGSGKTEVLTTRMAWDLLRHIPEPQGVACVTLTVAASEELRSRVDRLLTIRRPNVFIGTVHSFLINEIITPFARIVGREDLNQINIIDDTDAKNMLNSIVYDVYGPNADIRNIPSTVNINRRRLASDEQWARHDPRMKTIADRYTAQLRADGLVDFTELVRTAVDIVEHDELVRKALTARYPRIYVDEYQDLEPGLDRLVKAVCLREGVNSQLFAVGDPDQAIYGFTGTMPELLQRLADHPMTTPVRLEKNYRCGRQIIAMADTFKESSAIVVGDRAGGKIDVHHCPDGFTQQCSRAAAWIGSIGDRYPLHEIGLLCPTNEQCQQATAALRAAGIPAFYRSRDDYRATRATLFIEACAAWCCFGMEASHYQLANLLRTWRYILADQWNTQSDCLLTTILLDYTARAATASALELVETLMEAGMGTALRRPALAIDAPEVDKLLHALRQAAKRKRTPLLTDLAQRARLTDRVEVRTMTASKGLEFDAVVVLGLDEGRVPHFGAKNSVTEMREERRKFYVTLTRARDELQLFYSGYVEWRPGSKTASGPSRFLRELRLV